MHLQKEVKSNIKQLSCKKKKFAALKKVVGKKIIMKSKAEAKKWL